MNNVLPIFGVATYTYCPRDCYYTLIDMARPQVQLENKNIQSGRAEHAIRDNGYTWYKKHQKILSSVRVYSDSFGLVGVADNLIFSQDGEITVVEAKRGGVRESKTHDIQLGLIGLCVNEMFPKNKKILLFKYFTESRKRIAVNFQESVEEALAVLKEVRSKIDRGLIPINFPTVNDKRCKGCCFHILCKYDFEE